MVQTGPTQAGARRRQQTLLVFAVLVFALYALDVAIVGHFSVELLVLRLIWAVALAGVAVLTERVGRTPGRVLSGSYGVVTGAVYLGLVVFTGGAPSPYFYFYPCLPLVVSRVSNRYLVAAHTCGLVSALGGGGLLYGAEGSLGFAAAWSFVVLVMMFFGMYGGAQFQKARSAEAEVQLERSRREALEKLAVSERQRAQSEKLATIGRLAANVAHELNNPIAYVRSNLSFLEREVLSPRDTSAEELREAFQDVTAGVERIRQIVSDLQSFSRMDGALEPTECSLAEVVKDAARLASVRLKAVARLQVEVPEDLPGVYAVRRRLAQVILNLLVNAGDALEEHRIRAGEVRVVGRVEGSTVTLLVEDNGPGFPPEVLPRLFEAFFTTKAPEKGTGLGLSLSREFVEQFGGTLSAENRPEGGARLRITLPAHVREQEPEAAQPRLVATTTL
ncbi:MAG TPA: ATP-binding protein [Myxococcaceae bacterium]